MRSFWRWLAIIGVSCGLLAGCGTANTPEQPILQYVEKFNLAMTDSSIAEPKAHDRWAGELAAFFLPDTQPDQKERIKQWIALLGVGGGPNTYEIRDLKIEVVEETPTTAQYRITSGNLVYSFIDGTANEPFEHTGLGRKEYILRVAKVAEKWYLVPPAP